MPCFDAHQLQTDIGLFEALPEHLILHGAFGTQIQHMIMLHLHYKFLICSKSNMVIQHIGQDFNYV